MNEVFLIGNLSDDPKIGTTPSGVTRCTFRLATQRDYTNPQTGQKDADFHTIVAWRQLGELCKKFLAKGRQCAVRGTLQYRSYTAQDGTMRYMTEIIASKVKFLGGGSHQQGADQPVVQDGYIPTEGYMPVETDELPF